jgi:hypothetical protein
MTGARPERLTFSPALSRVDCKQDTNQGLIYPMSSPAWQHLPLCDEHDEGEGAAMMRELYADNYEERRLEILLRAAGRCEYDSIRRYLLAKYSDRRRASPTGEPVLRSEGVEVPG